MSAIPANVRVNVGSPFPSLVKGLPLGLVAINKQNGVWTVSLNYAAVGRSAVIADAANSYVLIYNVLTGVYTLVPVGQIPATKSVVTLNAAGPYAAQPSDDVILVKFTPMAITVDWSARTRPLTIVDAKGDAAANNITITPSAGQKQLAQLNYVYVIDGNGGNVTLTPLPDGTGAY